MWTSCPIMRAYDGHCEGEFREDDGGGLHGCPRISLIARSRTNRATSIHLTLASSSGHASHRCPTSSSAQCWSVVSTSSSLGRRLAIAIGPLLYRGLMEVLGLRRSQASGVGALLHGPGLGPTISSISVASASSAAFFSSAKLCLRYTPATPGMVWLRHASIT